MNKYPAVLTALLICRCLVFDHSVIGRNKRIYDWSEWPESKRGVISPAVCERR
jgi:hypothetical protein